MMRQVIILLVIASTQTWSAEALRLRRSLRGTVFTATGALPVAAAPVSASEDTPASSFLKLVTGGAYGKMTPIEQAFTAFAVGGVATGGVGFVFIKLVRAIDNYVQGESVRLQKLQEEYLDASEEIDKVSLDFTTKLNAKAKEEGIELPLSRGAALKLIQDQKPAPKPVKGADGKLGVQEVTIKEAFQNLEAKHASLRKTADDINTISERFGAKAVKLKEDLDLARNGGGKFWDAVRLKWDGLTNYYQAKIRYWEHGQLISRSAAHVENHGLKGHFDKYDKATTNFGSRTINKFKDKTGINKYKDEYTEMRALEQKVIDNRLEDPEKHYEHGIGGQDNDELSRLNKEDAAKFRDLVLRNKQETYGNQVEKLQDYNGRVKNELFENSKVYKTWRNNLYDKANAAKTFEVIPSWDEHVDDTGFLNNGRYSGKEGKHLADLLLGDENGRVYVPSGRDSVFSIGSSDDADGGQVDFEVLARFKDSADLFKIPGERNSDFDDLVDHLNQRSEVEELDELAAASAADAAGDAGSTISQLKKLGLNSGKPGDNDSRVSQITELKNLEKIAHDADPVKDPVVDPHVDPDVFE